LSRGHVHTLIPSPLHTLNLELNLKLNLKLEPPEPLLNFEPQYTQRHDNMEIDWKERIAKYGNGIDLETATDDDLAEYMETKMHLYTRHNLTDFSLWTAFQEDFEDFTPELFK
jgi:hypothetical protein